MSEYLGDFTAGATLQLWWNTHAIAGESITRATDGSIRIYKNNSLTQRSSSAGITDSEDFDGLTGVHCLNIVLSDNTDAGFYAAGNNYAVVLAAATIDGKVINAALGQFSIENRPVTLRAASFGTATLDGTFTFVTAPDVAAAVGDLALASHTAPGSLGLALQDIEVAALATNSAVDTEIATILAAVDTEMAAVKAKTDQLVFTTANRVDSQVYGIQPSVITAATINTDAITASKIASGAIDADALAADAGTEIGTAVWASTTRLLSAGTNIALAKGTGVTGFNDLSAAQVNTEVLDVLATDTFAEPGSVPAATASLKDMLHWLFTLARNKRTQTATTQVIRNDADSGNIASSTVSDSAGTLDVGEWS